MSAPDDACRFCYLTRSEAAALENEWCCSQDGPETKHVYVSANDAYIAKHGWPTAEVLADIDDTE